MDKKINIGLVGLGNVGSEFYKMVQKEADRFKIIKIAVRDKEKRRKVEVDKSLLTENISEVFYNPHIDVIVDASNDTPQNILERIIHKKETVPKAILKPYILASKKTMAFYGEEILKFAKENNLYIGFEATVCAGIPIVRLLREGHISEKIIEIAGILNGTTNYILTKMSEGESYEAALLAAQNLGYAEADPTEDISGLDSAYKLIILSGLCFGIWKKVDEVKITGINQFAGKIDFSRFGSGEPKLVALATRLKDDLFLKVIPCLCGKVSTLARRLRETRGVDNLIYIKTELRELYFSGPGAGGSVTAAAMMADLNFFASQMGIE